MKVGQDKNTRDQIAAIMLLHGTADQQREVLEYLSGIDKLLESQAESHNELLEAAKHLLDVFGTNKNLTESAQRLACAVADIERGPLHTCLEDVLEWLTSDGFVNGVHYDEESIADNIRNVLAGGQG